MFFWLMCGFIGSYLIWDKIWKNKKDVSLDYGQFMVLTFLPLGGFGTLLIAILLFVNLISLTIFTKENKND